MKTPAARKSVPLHEPAFEGNEKAYLLECLETGWVSSGGPFVSRFEKMVAERLGVKHAVAVVNGTSALHLALLAAGVKPGDEVLVPTLTFIATANAAVYAGAVPRFVDSEEATLGLDPDRLAGWLERETAVSGGDCRHRASGRRVSACVPMHAFGHPMRVERLLEVCRPRGIAVVEDAAESLGSSRGGRETGTFGRLGCLSFNGNKVLTTGGGGMVVTDDDAAAALVRHLSTQAKADPATYLHDAVGYNYRMPNVNAALGCAQLETLDAFLARKRAVAGWYRELLAGSAVSLVWEPEGCRSNFWLNTVRARTPADAARLLARLNENGFEARPFWTPCHLQPMFEKLDAGPLTTAERLWKECFNVPSSASVTREQAEAVAKLLR